MAQTFKGDVDFTLHDKCVPHRFEVSVTDENKVVLWIEDRQSKQQWHTSALEMKDYVTDDNAIPKATPVDYAERFAACLGSSEEDTKYKQTLTTKGSERVLTLTFVLQWISRDLAVDYKFVMREVPLERIDILGARMRDVEENFKQHVDGMEKNGCNSPVYAQATTKRQHSTNQNLVWTTGETDTSSAVQFLPAGAVRFLVAGVYAIDIGVTHSGASGVVFELKKAKTMLASCNGDSPCDSYSGVEHIVTTPLRYILKVAFYDEISVVYKAAGTCQAGSYLTVVKL